MNGKDSDWESIKEELQSAVNAGNTELGLRLAQRILEDGITPSDFFLHAIQPVLSVVGKRFERLEIFLPEMMLSAKVVEAMHKQVFEPAILEQGDSKQQTNKGTIVIGTIQGDLHDIGKSIVGLMLQVNGFQVIDIGIDIPPKKFIEEARDHKANIIAMSSLLTPSMPYMRDVIDLLEGWSIRDEFYVVVGGAPLTMEYASDIGADGFGEDAIKAVEVCNQLMKTR